MEGRRDYGWPASASRIALFVVVGAVVALIRFRLSPLYPPGNDLNGDVSLYTVIGNSWVHGFAPYRDVFDVKGPLLYMLFAGFALVAPWSMSPAWIFLGVLAATSAWLCFAISRRVIAGFGSTAVAMAAVLLIYLSPNDITASFSCEEVAVPAVLFLLLLGTRALVSRESIPAALWVLNGALFAAVVWIKAQMVGPYLAAGVVLVGLVLFRRVAWRSVLRLAWTQLIGFAVVTAAIFAVLAANGLVSAMLAAYLRGKLTSLSVGAELHSEVTFARAMLQTDRTGSAVLIIAAVLVIVALWQPRYRLVSVFCLVGVSVSTWAALFAVRHPYSFYVPRAYIAVALPLGVAVLGRALSRVPSLRFISALAALAMAIVICIPPLRDSRDNRDLLVADPSLSCTELAAHQTVQLPATTPGYAFAQWIERSPGARTTQGIMSYDFALGAEVDVINHVVPQQKFMFVSGWSPEVLAVAERTQRDYIDAGAVKWVWVLMRSFNPDAPAVPQIKASRGYLGAPFSPGLFTRYEPVLSCGTSVLFQAKQP